MEVGLLEKNRGFILIDAMISIVITTIIVLIIYSFYFVEIRVDNRIKDNLEELNWKKIETLQSLNTCIYKEKKDSSLQEP